MDTKPMTPAYGELFREMPSEQINLKHPLVRLADLIDCDRIDAVFATRFASRRGRPATAPRLIAGLLYLQHAFNQSDEDVVWGWVENPYWPVFAGETYLQIEPPIDPSSLTRWRQCPGEKGIKELLAATIAAAQRSGAVCKSSLKTVIVDTAVMPKAVAHPTDSRLLERSREHLVRAAGPCGLKRWQNYNYEVPRLALQIGRYVYARQFKRINKTLRTLRSRVGRVWRDIDRQHDRVAGAAHLKLDNLMAHTERILAQRPKDKHKLYALHAPEVKCISIGKAHASYELGVKVSITTTLKEGFVQSARSMSGNPYDGHTLPEALEQTAILSEAAIETAAVDRGYRGVDVPGTRILRSGQRQGITKGLAAMIKRRSVIEPMAGHVKSDRKLDRNWLKGQLGDALYVIL